MPNASKLRPIVKKIIRSRFALKDAVHDVMSRNVMKAFRQSKAYQEVPRQRVLLVGVQSDREPASLKRVFGELSSTRHSITTSAKNVEGMGKLKNTNILLSRNDLDTYDWVIMTDDDIKVRPGFVDDFLAAAYIFDLSICSPTHKRHSHFSHWITVRRPAHLARETNFVEVGPTVAFHRRTFAHVFPLPELKYGWGLDSYWPVLAREHGWKIGVIDAAPLRHLKPIGATYKLNEAYAEMDTYKTSKGIPVGPQETVTFSAKDHRSPEIAAA